jgi:EAL domain-containing protein (putative c-di-GMP-specific phosphodiesterase class I)
MHELGSNPTDLVWCLIGTDEQRHPHNVRVTVTPFTIGRDAAANLTLACRSVSGHHAELIRDGEELWVRDLQSTNGTFVNGQRIDAATPVKDGDYLQFAKVVFRLGRETASCSMTVEQDTCEQALAFIQFDKLMSERCMVPFLQPIVRIADGQTAAYEVLMRSRLFGLQYPGSMFQAASALDQAAELSRVCRTEGLSAGAAVPGQPHLFLNTHPVELMDPDRLARSLRELRELHPSQPITLEIHESAATRIDDIRNLRGVLAELKMGLAYDDFGAGQARLVELAEVPPDCLKFDMQLVQGIHQASPARQQMLGALVRMAHEMGIQTLAEGVETAADADTCRTLGFYFGRPAAAARFAKGETEAFNPASTKAARVES